MGLGRSAAAYQARLICDEGKVSLIAHALLLRKSQLTWRLRLVGSIVLSFDVALGGKLLMENHLTRRVDAVKRSIALSRAIMLAAGEGPHSLLQRLTARQKKRIEISFCSLWQAPIVTIVVVGRDQGGSAV